MTPYISAVPYTVPNAPTGLTAIAMNGQVTLNWTAPSFNGGRVIDYYVIYQNGVALLNYPTGLTAIINGLTNGQNYSFTVTAHNAAGIGARSINTTVIPFTTPGTPQGFTITPGNAQVTLSWIAPSFDGGRVITNYSVYRGIMPGGEILLVSLGNVLTYTDTSLINGQTYFYRVSAVDLAGVGPQSDEAIAIPYTVPNAPYGLVAIAGNCQVALNWTAPAFNGGNAIDYYVIYQDGVALLDHPTGLATIIGSLTNGLNYSFTVVAHNIAGLGPRIRSRLCYPFHDPKCPNRITGYCWQCAGHTELDHHRFQRWSDD